MNELKIMEKFISKVKEEISPYKEVFSPLERQFRCCIKKDEIKPIELQLQANFYQDNLELMIFPDPRIIKKENIISIIKFINAVNSYKINYSLLGRFIVLEDDLDIAFATNLSYDFIESYDEYFHQSVIKPIEIFCDILILLYLLSIGHTNFDMCIQMLDKKWGTIK